MNKRLYRSVNTKNNGNNNHPDDKYNIFYSDFDMGVLL